MLSYQSYYGGEARCVEQAGLGDEFDPNELVCGGCSDVAQAQVVSSNYTTIDHGIAF